MFKKAYLTGITREWRKCPIHNETLELYLDDSKLPQYSNQINCYNHEMNRIQWLCNKCGRFYSETLFIEKTKFAEYNNYLKAPLLLELKCPSCGSNRISHNCDPDCCDEHLCYDCNTLFNIVTNLIESKPSKIVKNQDDVREVRTFFSWGIQHIPPKAGLERTGLTRWWRSCPLHKSREMELCFLNGEASDDSRLTWYCDDCRNIYTENALRGHYYLFLEAFVPLPKCIVCGSINLSKIEDNHKIKCNDCLAILGVKFSILKR